MANTDEPFAEIAQFAHALGQGKLQRRQFLTMASGLGVSLPAAIALADNAMAQSCDAKFATVEINIQTDLQISAKQMSALENRFQTALVTTQRKDATARMAAPKEVRIKTKRKCICGK
jgi:hypothetical protein